VNGEYCGHQIYRRCKGWWEQSPEAAFCKYGREETKGKDFSGVARTFGYPNWDKLPEGQIRTKALKNINIQMGLYNHIIENPSITEYIDDVCMKIYQCNEEKFIELMENDERTKELSNVIIAINKETPDSQDKTNICEFLSNVENLLLETFNYYQGQYLPGPTIWGNFKKYIIEIEDIAKNEDFSINDRNDFAHTATKARRHYEELELYYNKNQNRLLEISDSLSYKTTHLSNLIKNAKTELINLISLYPI
jgi:hypothetical protein